MALPYEIILNNISIEGKYQIKKIISTRYNLNDYEYDGMYGNLIPSIKLGKNTYNFNSEDYGYYNQDADINLPSLEEIENAKQYEEEIKKPIFDDHSNDDLDLPTGKIRLRTHGSSGGHNGLKNIFSNLGTENIKRIKIGISNNKDIDTKDYVLGNIKNEEKKLIDDTVLKVSNISLEAITSDFNTLMSKYN